jgi:3-oxoadipate enol-lactonase
MRCLLIVSCILVATVSGWAQRERGFVRISDGQLYYEITGSGPPLVFLHGMCLDHRMWQQQVDHFSRSYTCINVDLRGFGKSSIPGKTTYSFHEDLRTLLDSLQIKKPVVLVALSMGGRAALNFSLAYPQRTKALILADAAIDGYRFVDFRLERIAEVAQQKGIDTANQLFLDEPIFASAKRDTAVFARLRQMVLSYSGWQWVHKNTIQVLTPPAIEQLKKIRVPVLIITGEKNIRDFQLIADMLHTEIKGSLKKEIADAGHMSNMEQAEVFNRMVSDFLITVR